MQANPHRDPASTDQTGPAHPVGPATTGQPCEDFIRAHVAHQVTDYATVRKLMEEIAADGGATYSLMLAALHTVALVADPASLLRQQALATLETLVAAKALGHAAAEWIALTQGMPSCAQH